MTIADLIIKITADTDKASRDIDNVGKKGSSSLGKLGKAAGAAALGLGVGAGVGLAWAAKNAVNAASNLNESTNAVNVTFGKAAPKVLKFSEGASKMGLSMREANELTTPIGASLRNAGYGADDAATASINLTKRAADMASVFNTSVPEALQAVQAGLRGEADPLERFGVGLSDQAVKAKGVEMGFKLVNDQLTPHAKAQARIALLMEQTNKVAGDFANTSDGLANQQRILRAEFENVQAKIGQKLIPVIVSAIGWLRDHWPEILAKLREFWANAQPVIQALIDLCVQVYTTIKDNWDKIGPVVTGVANIVKAQIKVVTETLKLVTALLRGDWSAAWNALKGIVRGAMDGVKAQLETAKAVLVAVARTIGVGIKNAVVGGITGVAGAVWDVINNIGGTIKDKAGAIAGWGANVGRGLINGIVSGLSGLGEKIVNLIRTAVNGAIDRINSLLSFSFSFDTHIPGVGRKSVNFDPPDIPHLARGTNLVQTDGMAFLHRGEAVVPADVAGGGFRGRGITVEGDLVIREEIDVDRAAARLGRRLAVAV